MSELITLRRAAKIRNRLTERLAELNGKLRTHSVSVNVYQPNIHDTLVGYAEDYNEVFSRFTAVSRVLLNIRKTIDYANSQRGVNNRLAESVALLGQLRVAKQLANIDVPRFSREELEARISGHLERLKVSEYAQDALPFTFISEEMVESAKEQVRDIQARLDVIQEELESINSTTKVELSDVDLAVLQQERII